MPKPSGTTATTPLNARQRKFVAEYLKDLHGTRAAIAAGYSEKTAFVIAAENLKKPNISAVIKEYQRVEALRYEITTDRIVRELAMIGLLPLDDCLKSANKYNLSDKRAALVDLGKHLGLFRDASLEGTDEHDVSIAGGLPDVDSE